MFQNCSSLIEAPELYPAALVKYNCARGMFNGCKKLSAVTTHLSAWDEDVSNYYWLNNVAANGLFRCKSELGDNDTIARGPSNCPDNWQVENF